MVTINESLQLKEINIEDFELLQSSMATVYPKAYRHLWEDGGDWYRAYIWNKQRLAEELEEDSAAYYFVIFEGNTVGILRYVEATNCEDVSAGKVMKLHRLYLDDSIQGKGVGKAIMRWTETYAQKTNHDGVWLEVMDTQEQALRFYERCGYRITGDFRLDFKLMHPQLRGMYRMYKALD